ncbi:hypothetical protein T492DRAFT_846491 [Pavlovales sp. CCMP2436]|nr:hypothetical protein T492DRAFT_846491 [Pavlovales sp. CCMP2436]
MGENRHRPAARSLPSPHRARRAASAGHRLPPAAAACRPETAAPPAVTTSGTKRVSGVVGEGEGEGKQGRRALLAVAELEAEEAAFCKGWGWERERGEEELIALLQWDGRMDGGLEPAAAPINCGVPDDLPAEEADALKRGQLRRGLRVQARKRGGARPAKARRGVGAPRDDRALQQRSEIPHRSLSGVGVHVRPTDDRALQQRLDQLFCQRIQSLPAN